MNRASQLSKANQASHASWLAVAGATIGLFLSVGSVVAAPSADHRFVSIATGQGPVFSTFGNYPSINSHGTVAFTTILADHSSYAIYKGDGTSVMKVIDVADPIFPAAGFRSIQNGPTINDSGSIAFGAYTGENGVWRTDGISPTLLYQPSINIEPSINEAGAVAFDLSVGFGLEGVAVASMGSLNFIADADDNFSGVTEPVLNDFGKAVFMGQSNGTVDTAIYTGDGGPLTTIVSKGDSINGSAPIEFFGIFPTINNQDEVVFTSTHTDGVQGIYRASAGAIEAVVDTTGPFASFTNAYGSRPMLNNQGEIIFYATLDGGGSGIFSGPDPVHDQVIRTGDTLFGESVFEFVFGSDSLNDQGQFAFQALMNGGSRIVRVDPIPEPATLLHTLLSVVGLVCLRTRRIASVGE